MMMLVGIGVLAIVVWLALVTLVVWQRAGALDDEEQRQREAADPQAAHEARVRRLAPEEQPVSETELLGALDRQESERAAERARQEEEGHRRQEAWLARREQERAEAQRALMGAAAAALEHAGEPRGTADAKVEAYVRARALENTDRWDPGPGVNRDAVVGHLVGCPALAVGHVEVVSGEISDVTPDIKTDFTAVLACPHGGGVVAAWFCWGGYGSLPEIIEGLTEQEEAQLL